jgi:hypothetical protein
MGNTKIARLPNFITAVVLADLCGLAAGLAVAPRPAAALPAHALKENRPCEYCHINPVGGGERNAMGKECEANGHKFKKDKIMSARD